MRLTRQLVSRGVTLFLIAGIACLAVLYLASIGPYWNISPDSASYVGWGKSLALGHGWGTPPVNPPLTALVFAGVLWLFPDGYFALNAITPLFLLAALGFALGPVRRRVGSLAALLVILLSLGSVSLYTQSSRLLSGPLYMACSMAALLLLDQRDQSEERSRRWLTGMLLIATVMTRAIGIALPLAVLLVSWVAWKRSRQKPDSVVVGLALTALLTAAIWEIYTGEGYVAGWLRMLGGENPWIAEAPRAPLSELLTRTYHNLPRLAEPGDWVRNSGSTLPGLDLALGAIVTLLILAGLVWSWRERISVVEAYVALYLLVVAVNGLAGGDRDYRFFVPVLPFLVCYTVLAVQRLIRPAGPLRIPGWSRAAVWGAVGLGVLAYLKTGGNLILQGVAAAHYSPFGDYPIKRPQNLDLQRAAFWLRRHSGPTERYASGQRDMIDVLAERRGYDLVVGRTNPHDRFISWLEERQIRYLLVDHTSALGDSLLAVVREYPAVFTPIQRLTRASLYRVQPR
jgi:hypothetical protein